eukprot:4606781-Prymnesium_polylepis.1
MLPSGNSAWAAPPPGQNAHRSSQRPHGELRFGGRRITGAARAFARRVAPYDTSRIIVPHLVSWALATPSTAPAHDQQPQRAQAVAGEHRGEAHHPAVAELDVAVGLVRLLTSAAGCTAETRVGSSGKASGTRVLRTACEGGPTTRGRLNLVQSIGKRSAADERGAAPGRRLWLRGAGCGSGAQAVAPGRKLRLRGAGCGSGAQAVAPGRKLWLQAQAVAADAPAATHPARRARAPKGRRQANRAASSTWTRACGRGGWCAPSQPASSP